MQHDARPLGMRRCRDGARHIALQITAIGRCPRREMRAHLRVAHDAVDAEGAPVAPHAVPGHQVPALAGVHHALRLHAAPRVAALGVFVVELGAQLVAACACQRRQHGGLDHGADAVQRQDGRAQRVHPLAQARGHGLLQLDQGAQRGLFDAAHRTGRGGAQRNRHSQGLVVVQQQRRQRLPGPEGVTARHAAAGMHRVAQLAQAVHIAPHGARVHLQPLGQLGAHPVGAGLQQGEQAQKTRR